MRALGKTLLGALLLCPGLTIGGDGPTQTEARSAPAWVAPVPPQLAAIWQHVINAAAALPRFPAPQPGLVWPPSLQFPAPVAIQPAAPAMWPLVWVLVPTAPAPVEVDYGPVAHPPVTELPAPDPMSAAATPGKSGVAEVVAQEALAATPPTVLAEPVIAPMALSEREAAVDYGPVTPTPVVNLLTPQPQAVARPRKPAPAAPKPVPKPAAKSPKASSKSVSKPIRRLCWTNGVVAPCR